jgi:Transcription factor Iwr1
MQNPFESGNRKRRASNSLTFMERRTRKPPSGAKGEAIDLQPLSEISEAQSSQIEAPRPQKKPGLAARTNGKDTPTPKASPKLNPVVAPKTVQLPNGKTMPWDVNSVLLAAEMQAYTLQEIGRNIEKANKFQSSRDKQMASPVRKPTQSRFKPKKPALRYAERHPEEAARLNQVDTMDVDDLSSGDENLDDDLDDDTDYIIDTYVRMPAAALQSSVSPRNFGLLILDSQPDIDEFYLDDQDSDVEGDEEDEDENGKL